MFYFKELYFRLLYNLLVLSILFCLCYINKNKLLLFVVTPMIRCQDCTIKEFIYTHPAEFFFSLLLIVIIFTTLFWFPFLCWSIFDFMKPSLVISEYNRVTCYCVIILFILMFINILNFVFLFPTIFFFFESFNVSNDDIINSNIKIIDYLLFLFKFLNTTNITFILFSIFINLILKKGLVSFLYYKNVLNFINIVLSTFISPPDVTIQLLLFILIGMTLEFIQIIILYQVNFKKEAN